MPDAPTTLPPPDRTSTSFHKAGVAPQRALRQWTALFAWRAGVLAWAYGLWMALHWGWDVLQGSGIAPRLLLGSSLLINLLCMAWMFAIGGVGGSIVRQTKRPVGLSFALLLTGLGVVAGLLLASVNPVGSEVIAIWSEPNNAIPGALVALGIWVLCLPLWPRRVVWRRRSAPPFRPVPPKPEAIALWFARAVPLMMPLVACLVLFGPVPFYTWPAGLIAGFWIERLTRRPESPINKPHLLPAVEWTLWLVLMARMAAGLIRPDLPASNLLLVQGATIGLIALLVVVAALRQRLRRATYLSALWLWPATVGLGMLLLWQVSPGPGRMAFEPQGTPMLSLLTSTQQLTLAGLTAVLFARVVFIGMSAYWWLIVVVGLMLGGWLIGFTGMALLWPVALMLWLVQRQIATRRLKWLTLAGLAAGVSWVWQIELGLWLMLTLLGYGLILGTGATALIDSQLEPKRTRWFALIATSLGLVPALVVSASALMATARLNGLVSQVIQTWQLAPGAQFVAATFPPNIAGALTGLWPVPIALLLVWWGLREHLRPRVLHPLASLLLILWLMLVLGWLAWLLTGNTQWLWIGLFLALPALGGVLAWRAGPAWHLPVPLHAPLLRGFLVAVGVAILVYFQFGLELTRRESNTRPAPPPASPVLPPMLPEPNPIPADDDLLPVLPNDAG